MPNQPSGKLADPAFRRQRAQRAAVARTSVDHHIAKLVDAAPSLTEAQRARIAAAIGGVRAAAA